MKPDQERVKSLLLDTVSLLCKNSLLYQAELRVEGVIGITVDKNDVFIVHINENYKGSATEVAPEISAIERENDQIRSHQILVSSQSPVRNDEMVPSPGLKNSRSIHRRPGQGSRRRSRDSPVDLKSVKTEKAEEAGIVIIDSKERLSAAGVTDDGELMRQGYPAAAAYENIGLDNIQAAISQYEQITNLSGNAIETATGEPAAKHRRLAQHVVAAQTDATSPFVTGVAARTAVEHALPPGWNSVTVPAGNAETSPGCSSWPGGAQVNADMDEAVQGLPPGVLFGTQRRPRESGEKTYVCQVPGCGKKFYHGYNLYRHQRMKHMNQIKKAQMFHMARAESEVGLTTTNVVPDYTKRGKPGRKPKNAAETPPLKLGKPPPPRGPTMVSNASQVESAVGSISQEVEVQTSKSEVINIQPHTPVKDEEIPEKQIHIVIFDKKDGTKE